MTIWKCFWTLVLLSKSLDLIADSPPCYYLSLRQNLQLGKERGGGREQGWCSQHSSISFASNSPGCLKKTSYHFHLLLSRESSCFMCLSNLPNAWTGSMRRRTGKWKQDLHFSTDWFERLSLQACTATAWLWKMALSCSDLHGKRHRKRPCYPRKYNETEVRSTLNYVSLRRDDYTT